MPATYRIEKHKPWIEMELSGRLTLEELATFMQRMRDDPDYSDDLWGVIDCRQMTNVLNLAELRNLADVETLRPGPAWRSKRAVLVASTEQYGTVRVYMIFAESSPIQYGVFYSRETAMEWLKE